MLKVEGRNIDLTDAIKAYVDEKVQRIHNHFDSIIKNHEIRVVLSVLKNPSIAKNQKAEVTMILNGGHVIRCEEAEKSIYASIDLVVDKIETQLRRHKTRIYNRLHSGRGLKEYGIEDIADFTIPEDIAEQVKKFEAPKIIKTKRFRMEALEPDTAAHKLDDSGHEFYMFLNVFTNRIACVYKRDDGDYGLIEPEFLQVAN